MICLTLFCKWQYFIFHNWDTHRTNDKSNSFEVQALMDTQTNSLIVIGINPSTNLGRQILLLCANSFSFGIQTWHNFMLRFYVCLFVYWGSGYHTQGLRYARQVLCHEIQPQAPVLESRLTSILFVTLAMLICTSQFTSSPIVHCFPVPAIFLERAWLFSLWIILNCELYYILFV